MECHANWWLSLGWMPKELVARPCCGYTPAMAAARALMTKAAARATSAARSHLHAGQRLSSRKRRDGGAIRPGGRPVHPADR